MSNLHRIAGNILGKFNAFKGSRPAMDNGKILIVRGFIPDTINIEEEADEIFDDIIKNFDGEEIDVVSDEAGKLINRMDEQVRSSISVNATTDPNGVLRLVKDFEARGITVKYRMFTMPGAGVFIVAWKDTNNAGPCFIEVTVSGYE